MNFKSLAEDFLLSTDLEYSNGENRKVFLVPAQNCVIKLPNGERGSEHNFGEWNFFLKTKGLPFHYFLQPNMFIHKNLDEHGNETWVNIQKIGYRACKICSRDFTCQMLELTEFDAQEDQHHFYNQDNFFFDKTGKLRIADYGNISTQEIIRKHGEKIYHQFQENKKYSDEDDEKIALQIIKRQNKKKDKK